VTATISTVELEPDHPHGPLRQPGSGGGLLEVFRRRYLLRLIVRNQLKVRYQGGLVGLAWSYVKPGVRFVMYFWVIGLLLGSRLPGRALHIFSALIMVTFFTEALSDGSRSVVKNSSLVRKIALPREMFPIASLANSTYHMFPMYLMLIVGCFIGGWHPDMNAAMAAVLALAIILTYGVAVALVFAAWNVFYRDIQNFTDVIQTVIMWMVPMIYPWGIVANRIHGATLEIYTWNPLTTAILLNQRAFWWTALSPHDRVGTMPSHLMYRGVVVLLVGFVLVWLAQRVFARFEGHFAEAF
jgi:ABC-2 type transport system permease protein